MQSLQEGKGEIFALLPKMPPTVEGTLNSLGWKMDDLFTIVNAFHTGMIDANSQEWKIMEIQGGHSCDKDEQAYSSMSFTFYKWFENPSGRYYRLERRIYIDPASKYITFIEDAWDAPGVTEKMTAEWACIDYSSIQVSAEEAIQIADENGGGEYFKSHPNDCRVILDYQAKKIPIKDSWRMYYYEAGTFTKEKLTIYVNVFTGETQLEP